MFQLKIMNSKSKDEIQFQKKKFEFEQKFYRLMLELNLYNKFNKTYWLRIVDKTRYGFYAQLYIVDGLSFSELQKKIDIIQESLCCIWIMKTKQFQEYADVQIVTEPIDDNLPYENPNIKPYQMYLGLNFSLKNIINDNNEHCMFLIAGATGAGKTRFIYMILLSWILGCKPEEVEIYLSDIAKDEYINFKQVRHVKWYASELEELHKMMLFLDKKIEKRKHLISKLRERGLATNIKEYNKISKEKIPYCYILIDELSVIMPDKTDSQNEKNIKQEILDIIKKIEKIGRSLGIFIIIATQKTVKEEMPSIVKNMSAVRISFRANDLISSEVIMGDNSAVGLSDRYAVYSLNGGDKKDYLFSPLLTTEMLNELLEPFIDKKTIKKSQSCIQTKLKIITQEEKEKIIQQDKTNNNSIFEKEDMLIDY